MAQCKKCLTTSKNSFKSRCSAKSPDSPTCCGFLPHCRKKPVTVLYSGALLRGVSPRTAFDLQQDPSSECWDGNPEPCDFLTIRDKTERCFAPCVSTLNAR